MKLQVRTVMYKLCPVFFLVPNSCSPNPCLSGGTCTDGVDSYICECDTGYTGVDCETTSKYSKLL